MSMIKIGMIGIAAVFLALLLKKEKGELALLVGIAASVLIFGYTLSRISFILDFLRELMDTLPVDPALLKAHVWMALLILRQINNGEYLLECLLRGK